MLALAALAVQAPAPTPLAPSAGVDAAFLATGDLCGGPGAEVFLGRTGEGYAIVRIDEATGRWEVQPAPIAPGPALGDGQVAAADVDGDGRIDLLHGNGVVFNETPAGSSRFEGVDVPFSFVGAEVSRLVGVPDVDGDGLGDPVFLDDSSWAYTRPLVIARQVSPRVLAAPQPYAAARLRAATVIDADGDGDLDIAVVTEDFRLQVWESGAPSTAPTVVFDAQLASGGSTLGRYDLVADDLDADGHVDLVVVGNEFGVYRGNGSGSFAAFGASFPVHAQLGDAELIDVDGDGDLDLTLHWDTLEYYLGGGVSWVERTGPLEFAGPFRALTTASFGEAKGLDLDGDGVGDDIVATGGLGILGAIALPAPAGAGADFERVQVGPYRGPATASFDLDGDGDRDVVAVDQSTGALIALETVATGQTREWRRLGPSSAGRSIAALRIGGPTGEHAVATLRFDGRLALVRDLVAPGGPVSVDLGDGFAQLDRAALDACDQDGDGDDDLLALRQGGAALEVVRQGAAGAFDPQVVVASAPQGRTIESFVPCEWDGAAPIDLVVVESSTSGQSVRLLRGTAGGFVDAGPPVAISGPLRAVRAAAPHGLAMGVFVAVGSEVLRYGTTPAGTLQAPVPVVDASPLAVSDFQVDDTSSSSPAGRIVVVERQNLATRLTAYPLGGAGAPLVLGPTPSTIWFDALDDIDGDGALDALLSTDTGLWWARGRDDAADLEPYCRQPDVNSIGLGARLRARAGAGQASGVASTLRLDAVDLPPGATTLFLTGRAAASLPGAGGALGTLCLGGTLGRFLAPGQVLTANAGGSAGQDVDPLALPSGGQLLPIAGGDVWAFQAWYRDVDAAGNPVSRLTDAVLATF